ncbi:MAG TPA: RimK domain-containing protein ATP-grasp [Chloroflexota bacterium]
MIALWGLEREAPLACVGAALGRFGADVLLLDQRWVAQTDVRLSQCSGVVNGRIQMPSGHVDLRRVQAMYARPFGADQLVSDSADSAALRHMWRIEHALWTWAELTPAMVVNRASAMAPNHSKPFQSMAIERAGFRVPETLVTTSPAAARAFWNKHGEVIYKSLSSVRSRVTRVRAEHLPRLANVVWCPTQFQAYVPGREHRVHVVGDRIFACEIVSDADDYRYPDGSVELRHCELPPDVADRCRRLTADQNLLLAGIDLRRTPDGEWYCFEVNPSPAFPYFESASGPIAEAIAHLLMGAR